jgi:hypothetical protein
MLGKLAADLRVSPRLQVIEKKELDANDAIHPDVILVDAAQSTPEQFRLLIPLCPTIFSIDPETHQLIVLSSPHQENLAELARVIERISLMFNPLANEQDK